jgi:hypothetical protein
LLLGVFLLVTTNHQVYAQDEALSWRPQQRIPGYLDSTEPPILVSDPAGIVHAFAYQQVGDPDEGKEIGIIYSTWTYEAGWTLPNDIILSPIKHQARVMDVYLDNEGVFHLIFYGGDEVEAYIYYSTAVASAARSAHAWSPPVIIGERPLTPSLARIGGDGNGNLLVIYSGQIFSAGLFGVHSLDNGKNWSKPQPHFLTYNNAHRSFNLQLSPASAPEKMHAVWNVVNERGRNVAGYYAQLDLQTVEFTDLTEIDEGIGVAQGMGVANPSVVEYNDQIIVAYNNGIPPDGVPPTNWTRRSNDGGETWTERQRISAEHVGRNGVIAFVEDSDRRLHIFYGMRIPQEGTAAIHGMWHNTWQDGDWSETDAVVSGPGGRGFDPYDARAVIIEGNELLVTWRTDPGNSELGVWYSATKLNTLPISAQPLPDPEISAGAEGEASLQQLTSDSVPTEADGLSFEGSSPPPEQDSGRPLWIGLLSSVLIIMTVVLARRVRDYIIA